MSLHSFNYLNDSTPGRGYQDALQYLKSGSHGQVKWAKSTGKPGDRRFVCNMHEGCQRAYRICGDPTGESQIQEYMGIAHSGLPKEKNARTVC